MAVEQYATNVPEGQLAKPNNILGLHYLIALERLNSRMVPLTITRQKAEYHQQSITDRKIASATALRRLLFEHGDPAGVAEYVPEGTLEALVREWAAGRAPVSWASFFKPLMLQLLSRPAAELSALAEVTEGLEHRIKRVLPTISANDDDPMEQLFKLLKTKRYTRVKLQRTLLRILLNHRKEQLSRPVLGQGVPYLRVLGFSAKGRELLKRMKTTAKVPVVMKAAEHSFPLLELDIRASSVYALAYARTSSDEMFRDYYQSPIRALPPDGS
jgi:predicted nucleotidyltransferase